MVLFLTPTVSQMVFESLVPDEILTTLSPQEQRAINLAYQAIRFVIFLVLSHPLMLDLRETWEGSCSWGDSCFAWHDQRRQQRKTWAPVINDSQA